VGLIQAQGYPWNRRRMEHQTVYDPEEAQDPGTVYHPIRILVDKMTISALRYRELTRLRRVWGKLALSQLQITKGVEYSCKDSDAPRPKYRPRFFF
jgi:hypothetical protein